MLVSQKLKVKGLNMKPNDTIKKLTVAYAPFKTFLSAIQALEHGVPDTIDRTVWPSFSGVMQSQLLVLCDF